MNRPVTVMVLGATPDDPPPGLPLTDARWRFLFTHERTQAAEAFAAAEIVFFWGGPRSWIEDHWDDAASLRWIQSASDGVDRLLFPALVESDVTVTNARGVFDDPIAEWAIAAFLSFATGLHRSERDTVAGLWDDDRGRRRVSGSTLCVLGPGPIGRATARRARDLGIHVTAVGRAPRTDDVFGTVAGPEGLHAALADADFVLDALPLAPGTERYVDAAAFAAMKPGVVFANVGRGATVDEAALIAALASGHLGGVALDVVAQEPLPTDSPLWSFPNVIVSPHVCGDVEGWEAAVVAVFVDNLERDARGEPLHNVVDKAAGFGGG